MPELFVELFSEEIPARLQQRAAEDLLRLVTEALSAISPGGQKIWYGPRRLALAATVLSGTQATKTEERGPRITAPEQALAGFLRKHAATPEALRRTGDFWVLEKSVPAITAAALIATTLPGLLWRFPWPKSMRWGGSSSFTWIRPLRRITCLLDGEIVVFTLTLGEDDGHGLHASNLTEGHRLHAPGPVAVSGAANWQATLHQNHVIADAAERAALIRTGIARLAEAHNLTIVEDPALIEEVAGLVEWPVPLLGRIDASFMTLPPEVMQVSMRINQRYFATRHPDGTPAPHFAFVANLEAPDQGADIIAGNERVLRARFADARHFYDLDRRTKLADRVQGLDGIIFQAELGTQGDRVRRIVRLAEHIAPFVGADPTLAARAALLCKADLTTGMVGEFPELQGVMGGYYAAHDGEDSAVCTAIREHYAPKGAADAAPKQSTAIAVALADKLDQLAAFFAISQKPTGSGDPYALRRAALGVIRIIRVNGLRLQLSKVVDHAFEPFAHLMKPFESVSDPAQAKQVAFVATKLDLVGFVVDRLQVALRSEPGARADTFAAAYYTKPLRLGLDITALIHLSKSIADFIVTDDGRSLLAAYKRAANILKIEDKKDGPHVGGIDELLLKEHEELMLVGALSSADEARTLIEAERFTDAMQSLARLREPLDAFFEKVTVNSEDALLRANRLKILSALHSLMNTVANFSAIES